MDDKALEASLVAIVKGVFTGPNREELSVNNVRQKCEEENGLEEGFFNSPEWKNRSKLVIKGKVVRCTWHIVDRGAAPSCRELA